MDSRGAEVVEFFLQLMTSQLLPNRSSAQVVKMCSKVCGIGTINWKHVNDLWADRHAKQPAIPGLLVNAQRPKP